MDNRYTDDDIAEAAVRERILVVDDEEPIREILVSMLAGENYQCRQAASGKEALAILDSGEQFDLISTDLMMPDVDGIELLEQVNMRFPDLPLVFVSAVHDVAVALASLRHGALDYLLVPFERQDLLAMIRRAFETHRLRTDAGSNKTSLELLLGALSTELHSKLSKLKQSDEKTIINALGLRGDHSYFSRLVAIFKAMGLPDRQIEAITRGMSSHYASQVPALMNILLRPERLLPDELALICNECHKAYKIFQNITCLADASEIMFACYERFDGTGYPRGLKADEIPLGARILGAVYFASDINTSAYLQRSVSPMRAEIQRWSGSRFDPEVVKAVLSVPDPTWATIW